MHEITNYVYIVEDNAHIREAVMWVLQSVGYRVQAFTTAEEFLDFPSPLEPFCLITDLELPNMNGLNLCREILARQMLFTFIIMSAQADVSSVVEALNIGAIDFLEKPFSRHRLLEVVKRAFQEAAIRCNENESKAGDFDRTSN